MPQKNYRDKEPLFLNIFELISGCFCTASEKEQKITPASANFSLKVVATETLSNTHPHATPAKRSCSCKWNT